MWSELHLEYKAFHCSGGMFFGEQTLSTSKFQVIVHKRQHHQAFPRNRKLQVSSPIKHPPIRHTHIPSVLWMFLPGVARCQLHQPELRPSPPYTSCPSTAIFNGNDTSSQSLYGTIALQTRGRRQNQPPRHLKQSNFSVHQCTHSVSCCHKRCPGLSLLPDSALSPNSVKHRFPI